MALHMRFIPQNKSYLLPIPILGRHQAVKLYADLYILRSEERAEVSTMLESVQGRLVYKDRIANTKGYLTGMKDDVVGIKGYGVVQLVENVGKRTIGLGKSFGMSNRKLLGLR